MRLGLRKLTLRLEASLYYLDIEMKLSFGAYMRLDLGKETMRLEASLYYLDLEMKLN